jgi:NTE family protein
MRSRIAAGTLTVVAACIGGLSPAWSQQLPRDGTDRPVIGLVLSGGGARGGAHIGVIEALEELRVPVDVIAGTSIGAAIGGLYATGMSVQDLKDFIDGIDWDAAFLNTTPRRLQSFRRKREDDLFLLDIRPGLGAEGVTLPAGVVQGQVIDTVMSRETLPVRDIHDFDNLAIPFRAVAGNIETGEAVVLSGGNLARALRASMSVPAVLTPIEIDGAALVDGGIAMNLPVEVAQSMGADRIIAIDVSQQLLPRDDIRSVVGVTSQLTNLLTRRATVDQIARLGDGDILLTPEFDDEYNSVSFAKLAETIGTGYDYVMANRALFEPYELSPEAYAAYKAALPDPRTPGLPTIDFVRTEFIPTSEDPMAPLEPSIIQARLGDIELGQPLDVDALETSLNRVYGLEVYQNVRYEVVRENGQQGLLLDLVEKSWGPDYGQLGLRYISASDEDPRFGVAASYIRTGINEHGREWRGTFLFGDEPGFVGDLYQPLGPKGLNFINPGLNVLSNQLNIFEDQALVAEVKLREATFELGGGREFLDWAELRGGFRIGAGDTRLRVGDPAAVPFDSFHRGETFARFSIDTLDNISFPREGTFTTIELAGSHDGLLGASHDYDQLKINAVHARTLGRNTLLTSLRYDATISGTSPAFALFGIGGFRDLSGLNSHELTGQHATRLGASYYRRFGGQELFPIYAGVSAEIGNVWQSRSDISLKDSILGGSIWAGVDTPVGPVFVAYGNAEGGDHAVYLFLGRLF